MTTTATTRAAGGFDQALAGAGGELELADGTTITLPVRRWLLAPSDGDEALIAGCTGPALDVGCGPGRLTEALHLRGVPSLGVDSSPLAVLLTQARGVPVLHRDVFAPLPATGRWREVLLADGNIGIGGDPVRLLRRIGELLGPGGSLRVELDPPTVGVVVTRARMRPHDWFPWARVGAGAIHDVARAAGFSVAATSTASGRHFARLERS